MNLRIERLERLQELREKGALTDAEFNAAKSKIMGERQTVSAANEPERVDADPALISTNEYYDEDVVYTPFRDRYRAPLKWATYAGVIFLGGIASFAFRSINDQSSQIDQATSEQMIQSDANGWVINSVDRDLGFCEAKLVQPNFNVTIIPDKKNGSAMFLVQDMVREWPLDAAFIVYVDGRQNFASLNTPKPDGSLFTSTNNSVSFEYPISVLDNDALQVDLYGFGTGSHIKSYPLRNKAALSRALRSCSEGAVPSLPEATPTRPPELTNAQSPLPTNELDLFRLLSGSSSTRNSAEDSKGIWEFKKLDDGECIMYMLTPKARVGFDRDDDPENVKLYIQNRWKKIDEPLPLETSIDGEVRIADLFMGDVKNEIPMIEQRFVPISTFDKKEVEVKVLITDPELESKLWDTFVIHSPPDLDSALKNCKL